MEDRWGGWGGGALVKQCGERFDVESTVHIDATERERELLSDGPRLRARVTPRVKGNRYLLDFLRGSAQFRIIIQSLQVINTGGRAHPTCQLPSSAQYHRGRAAAFLFPDRRGAGGGGLGGELGSPLQSSFLLGSRWHRRRLGFFEGVGRCHRDDV